MSDVPPLPVSEPEPKKRMGCLAIFGIGVVAGLVAGLLVIIALKFYLFPSPFKPVALKPPETAALEAKLDRLDAFSVEHDAQGAPENSLQPEPYSENAADRTVRFTERELNALIAKNPDLAQKVAIDLSDDLITAKMRLPMDPDVPVVGGQILRLKAGAEFSYEDGRPVVVLRGVTVMGAPMPNAWLGGLKNVDLVETFGTDAGFWTLFADGIAHMQVEDGRFAIVLNE